MKAIKIPLFLIFFHHSFSHSFNLNLIKAHLLENHLKFCIILSDKSVSTNVHYLKSIQAEGISTIVYDISRPGSIESLNFTKIFKYYYRYGVAIDLNMSTNKTNAIFGKVSERTLFHNNYFWLMFGSSFDKSYQLLEGENINVDAEIMLAIAKDQA